MKPRLMDIDINKIIDDHIEKRKSSINNICKIYNDAVYSIDGISDYVTPEVLIVNSHVDAASEIYVRNKIKEFEKYNIHAVTKSVTDKSDLVGTRNQMQHYDSVIFQLPFKKMDKFTTTENIIRLVPLEKDIDRLHPAHIGTSKIPPTSQGIKDVLTSISLDYYFSWGVSEFDARDLRVLFIGNGYTTHKRLIPNLLDDSDFHMDIRVVNSKSSRVEVNRGIEWADVIVSSTGRPESLKCEGKIVISPTIHKTEDCTWVSDLHRDCVDKNNTHKVLGKLGKLTVANIIHNVWSDFILNKSKFNKEYPNKEMI